jgi:hypothetical protein
MPRSAKSGANPNDPITLDPDLTQIVTAWPALPTSIRRAILALISANGNDNR